MAQFSIKNVTDGRILVGSKNLAPNEVTSTDAITGEIVRAYRKGVLTITPNLSAAMVSTPLVDSTGGTAGATLAAVGAGGAYLQADQVAIKNGLASLVAAHNAATARIAALEKLVYDILFDRYD